MTSLSLVRRSLDKFRSPRDTKSYRLVTLSNGLEVLVVQHEWKLVYKAENSTTNNRDARNTLSISDNTNIEDQIASPSLAAACLTVDVGSLADPKSLPGLAHYLEHMIFMGSTKYPDEDSFEVFLSAHGGSSNGATECESTRFDFDVDAAYLATALDMFASLFVAPLLRQEAMERELKAIESEFERVRNNNSVRLQQVMCETSVQGHPYSRCFTWGNANTLKNNPEQKGIDVREQMLRFFNTYYVAPMMKLCVYGCESLDILEQYVTQSFGDIPHCRYGYDVPRSLTLSPSYGGEAGQPPTVLHVISVCENLSLRLYWMLPSMLVKYRQKPWQYVAYLLGHEGPGSMIATLKQKKWATDVIVGTCEDDAYEFTSFGTVFEIRVSPTDEGHACWEQLVQVIFDALHFLSAKAAKDELPGWIFEELRSSSEITFRFQEDDVAPVALCRALSQRMMPRYNVQQTCDGDLLRYDLIQGDFDCMAVCAFLAQLSADSVRVVLVTPSFTSTVKSEDVHTERWFGTKYTISPILDTIITFWSQSLDKLSSSSSLPSPNVFIPRDFSILSGKPVATTDVNIPPDLILSTSTTQLWYKLDRTFLIPKASVNFFVALPSLTPTISMLAELHVEVVRRRLHHTIEQAEAAYFNVELGVRDGAIEIVVAGFSDTLPVLVRTVLREMLRSSSSSEMETEVALAQVELEREYRNATLSPRAKAYELRLQMLERSAITTCSKLEALESKEDELAADLQRFTSMIFEREKAMPVVRCLVIGNMNRETAVSLALDVEVLKMKDLTARLAVDPEAEIEPELPLLTRPCHIIALPPTINGILVRRESERIGDHNSVVEVYFQIGKVEPKDRAYVILLRNLLAQPLYNELRTRQQLGYAVTCSIRDTYGVIGLSVSVQSASHVAGVVAKELDTFLHERFLNDYLLSESTLSPKCFAAHVQTLQRAYLRPDSTLTDQSERYWEEIVTGRLEFDLEARLAIALGKCTRKGLISRYRCWLQGSSTYCSDHSHTDRQGFSESSKSPGPRKLRVHILGKSSVMKPMEQLVPREKVPLIVTGDLQDFKGKLQCHCHVDRCTERKSDELMG